ncbi:preprotein translocase subunit SecE [Candidatus Ishikawella capsulata]|nr:preprotein translocase subunit SecE [Candidatus Ishikawaella capsulata]
MNANSENQAKGNKLWLERIKWISVVGLFLLAVGSKYYLHITHMSILITLLLIIATCVMLFLTTKGKALLLFANEAQNEIGKVVWPTCQESIQTTFIILAVTIVMSIIIWGLDRMLVRILSFITEL